MTDSSVTGRNQNNSDVRDESARDNDPLFELSRIFGFEEPADQTNAQFPQAETEIFSEISLERELMADFDAEFAMDFAEEPQIGDTAYQPIRHDDRVEAPADVSQAQQNSAHVSERSSVRAEPRFTGYAPLQRAYSDSTTVATTPEPTFSHDEPQYYAETPVEILAETGAEIRAEIKIEPEASADAYDAVFSEPQQDYFSASESELSHSFVPEAPIAPQYEAPYSGYNLTAQDNGAYSQTVASLDTQNTQDFDLPDFDENDLVFEEVGREPHPEFVIQSFDRSDDNFSDTNTIQAQQFHQPHQTQAALSLEDELAFLLHDQVPVAVYHAQPVANTYVEPQAYQPKEIAPPAYADVASEADFAPLFDTPAYAVSPVEAPFLQEHEAPAYERAQIDDEFFEAPDLQHLPNRISSAYSYQDEAPSFEGGSEPETRAGNSFADLFGASSQITEPVSSEFAETEQEVENFDFDDDFFVADNDSHHDEQPDDLTLTQPASQFAEQPVSHYAVRGFSSYTFGAATAGSAIAEPSSAGSGVAEPSYADMTQTSAQQAVSTYNDDETPVAATGDFFSHDDFDFSFDEDAQTTDGYSADEAGTEEDLPEVAENPAYQPSIGFASKSFSAAPEVESFAVSENKVEQTQAFDLPDVSFVDDTKQTGLNSLESEFAEIFSTISVSEAPAPDSTSEADKAFENILQDNFADYHASVKADAEHHASSARSGFGVAAGAAGLAAAAMVTRGSASQADIGQANAGQAYTGQENTGQENTGQATPDDYFNHWAAQNTQTNDFDTYNLGDNFTRDEQEYEDYLPRQENPLRKPALWASVAAVAVIVIGGGYYLLKSGGVVGGDPVVIHADTQPVKIQPENRGGTVVPNQDKAVYDQVSGNKSAAPEQKTLINTEEEPVDVGLLQGQDAEEDRVLDDEPSEVANPQEAQHELITPRTVKTMVVRADGTLVPSEASSEAAAVTPAPATDTGLDEASRLISQSAVPERLGTDKPLASAQSAAAPRVVQTQTFTASGEQAKPRAVTAAPVVPSRPAEQPVNVAGNTARSADVQNQTQNQSQIQAPQQVASANVAAGTWFIQVASQPSAELAQKNYANLTSRFGNIIGGRGVDIKKADIAGKGTYYRVRIPGGTKAEAAALCERLKSAGGSCFPTL